MRRLWLPYAAAAATGLVLLAGLVSVVEITYHYSLEASTAPEMTLFGFGFNVTDAMPWAVAVGLLVGGFIAFNCSPESGRPRLEATSSTSMEGRTWRA